MQWGSSAVKVQGNGYLRPAFRLNCKHQIDAPNFQIHKSRRHFKQHRWGDWKLTHPLMQISLTCFMSLLFPRWKNSYFTHSKFVSRIYWTCFKANCKTMKGLWKHSKIYFENFEVLKSFKMHLVGDLGAQCECSCKIYVVYIYHNNGNF